MSALDTFKRASFASIAFPYKSCRVQGALRDKVHEYPHVPGGAPEKLGRKLYEIHFSCIFDERLIPAHWADLWPHNLATLRTLWENGETADLVLPSIGTVKAYCRNWTQTLDAKIRSGEAVELEFVEDQESGFANILPPPGGNGLGSAITEFLSTYAARRNALTEESQGLLDGVQDAANSVLSIKDQVSLYGSRVEAQVRSTAALFAAADKQVRELNDPTFYDLLDSFQGLWAAIVALDQDLVGNGGTLQRYVVPMTMPVAEIARALFGDSTRTADLLQLNGFPDPFAVPAGYGVNYYPAA